MDVGVFLSFVSFFLLRLSIPASANGDLFALSGLALRLFRRPKVVVWLGRLADIHGCCSEA